MKKITILLFASLFLILSCEEASIVIHPDMEVDPTDTTDTDSTVRQVLIEEFTGVRCVNCPEGSIAIENLLETYDEQLVAISIHSGFFAPPLSESQYDFRFSDADNLLSFLGEPVGYPTAVVNRKIFDGESSLQLLGQTKWAGRIAEEIEVAPKVDIEIVREFDDATRELTATVRLNIEETITEDDVRITVLMTESGIMDAQLTPTGIVEDYSHKHVLRGFVTNYNGDPITESLTAGSEIVKEYTYTLPEDWVASKCTVVALVSLGGAELDVLQAHEVGVVE